MPEVPIMCTLTPSQTSGRMVEFETLFAWHLIGLEREPLRLRLIFDVEAEQEEQARDLFAREQECCAFLGITVVRGDAGLVVDVTAPGEAEPVLDDFQDLAERRDLTRERSE